MAPNRNTPGELNSKQSKANEGKAENLANINPILTNPIMSGTPIVSRTSANKLYSAGSARGHLTKQVNIGFQEIMRLVNDALLLKNDLGQLFYSLNNILVNKMQVTFTALGLIINIQTV